MLSTANKNQSVLLCNLRDPAFGRLACVMPSRIPKDTKMLENGVHPIANPAAISVSESETQSPRPPMAFQRLGQTSLCIFPAAPADA